MNRISWLFFFYLERLRTKRLRFWAESFKFSFELHVVVFLTFEWLLSTFSLLNWKFFMLENEVAKEATFVTLALLLPISWFRLRIFNDDFMMVSLMSDLAAVSSSCWCWCCCCIRWCLGDWDARLQLGFYENNMLEFIFIF